MSIDGDLNTYLSTQLTLVAGRVYTDEAPQGTVKPYCGIVDVSDIEDYMLTGHSGAHEVHRQISCFAATGGAARAVEAQVVAALKAWSVPCRIENRYTVSEEGTLFHRAVDIEILYQEE